MLFLLTHGICFMSGKIFLFIAALRLPEMQPPPSGAPADRLADTRRRISPTKPTAECALRCCRSFLDSVVHLRVTEDDPPPKSSTEYQSPRDFYQFAIQTSVRKDSNAVGENLRSASDIVKALENLVQAAAAAPRSREVPL